MADEQVRTKIDEFHVEQVATPIEPVRPGSGLATAPDEYGLAQTAAKGQARIVLGRFFHQPLAVTGLCTFGLLALAGILVGQFWTYKYTDITNTLNAPPSWGF